MVDCYYTFLADITLIIYLYYILQVMLIIFMVDYIYRLPHMTEMGVWKVSWGWRGWMQAVALSAFFIAPRLYFRPSLESTPRKHHEIIFFSFHKII